MLFALMVMPRSRSRSMESRTCSCISRCESAPVISIRRSASVDLPWSMCAMMQKFRWNVGSMYLFGRQKRKGSEPPACVFLKRGCKAADPEDARWEHSQTAQNRCLGMNSFSHIEGGVSRTGRFRKREPLTTELIDDPKNQADENADHEAGDQRKIKCAVLAAIADVSWQAAKAERKFWTEVQEGPDEDEHGSDGKQQASELLHGLHAESLALERFQL